MFPQRKNIRPCVLWTLAFLGALVLTMNGTIFYSIKTAQRMLDVELGKRLEGTARIAALLVRPEHVAALAAAARDTASADSVQTDFVLQMDAIEAQDRIRQDWTRLTEGAEASNIVLLDPTSRVLFRLHEAFGFEQDVLTLDRAALARAFIGEPSHSALYQVDGQYFRSGYAPVVDDEGAVIAAAGG